MHLLNVNHALSKVTDLINNNRQWDKDIITSNFVVNDAAHIV